MTTMTDAQQVGLYTTSKIAEQSGSKKTPDIRMSRSIKQQSSHSGNNDGKDQRADAYFENTSDHSIESLSNIDLKILKHLLSSGGSVSSYQMSSDFGIPLTTIHRRRKRLESAFLKASYLVNMEKFGLHEGTFLVSTTGKGANSSAFGKELLSLPEVVSAHRTIGYHGVNWVLEAIYADSKAMANIVERIKAVEGVVDVIWMELIEKFHKATDDYCQMLTTGQVLENRKR